MLKNRSLKSKFKLASFAGISLTILIGVIAFWSLAAMDGAAKKMSITASALRNHLEADMMHDALRGDVLAALLAADQDRADQQSKVQGEMREHATRFRQFIENNSQLDLSTDIKRAIDDVRPVLTEYIGGGESIVGLAFKDSKAAFAAFPDFMKRFTALEGRMARVMAGSRGP